MVNNTPEDEIEGIENIRFWSKKAKQDCEGFYAEYGHLFSVSQIISDISEPNRFVLFDIISNAKGIDRFKTLLILYDMSINRFVDGGCFVKPKTLKQVIAWLNKRLQKTKKSESN